MLLKCDTYVLFHHTILISNIIIIKVSNLSIFIMLIADFIWYFKIQLFNDYDPWNNKSE